MWDAVGYAIMRHCANNEIYLRTRATDKHTSLRIFAVGLRKAKGIMHVLRDLVVSFVTHGSIKKKRKPITKEGTYPRIDFRKVDASLSCIYKNVVYKMETCNFVFYHQQLTFVYSSST